MVATHGTESEFIVVTAGARLRRRRSAAGFTLVELLMVILIISMLMGMLSVAIWKAFDRVNEATMVMEIEQITNAMNAYNESIGQYPPSLSDAVLTERKARFMRHLTTAFSNSNYGATAAHFDNLRNSIRTAGSLGTASQGYTFKDSGGTVQLLDLNTLDQAEALVFWLSGFPTPVTAAGVPVAPSRTYGFNRDKDNPFRRDSIAAESTDPMRFRTDPRMEFKQERFGDNDGDGWLEYLPRRFEQGTTQAPLVYFDSPTYNASTTAPGAASFNITGLVGYPRHLDPAAQSLASVWGLAVPMAEQYDANGTVPMRWQRPKNFQIIHPGKDGVYSAGETGDLAAAMRFSVYPSGETYNKAGNYKARSSYSTEEMDNLNNLGTLSLDSARSAAK